MNLYILLTFIVFCMFAVWFIFWCVEHPQLIPKCFQKKKRSYDWEALANYCQETYGIYVDWDERFFMCPNCEEPIYEYDWFHPDMFKHEYLIECPICEYEYYDEDNCADEHYEEECAVCANHQCAWNSKYDVDEEENEEEE